MSSNTHTVLIISDFCICVFELFFVWFEVDKFQLENEDVTYQSLATFESKSVDSCEDAFLLPILIKLHPTMPDEAN